MYKQIRVQIYVYFLLQQKKDYVFLRNVLRFTK